ncbi:MAG: ABC transporter ATP-binding protein/permease [Anaerolineaceae bacterium]|nr:ABC transporter ATP-binding protein/permease [Anaerolineaceae bacterium]
MRELIKLKRFLKPYTISAILSMALMVVMVGLQLMLPRMIQRIVDLGITPGNMTIVWQTTLVMLGISLLNMAFAVGNTTLAVRVAEGYARDLRKDLFNKIQSLSFGNLDRLHTGQLIVRTTSDVTSVQHAVRMMLSLSVRALMLLAGSLILMFSTNSQLAVKLLPFMLLILVLIVIFAGKLQKLFTAVQQKLDKLNNVLQENLSGVRVVKAFVRAAFENERFSEANEEFTQQNIAAMRLMAVLMPLMKILLNLGTVSIIWFGGMEVIQGSMTIGQIMAFTNYLMTAMFPMLMLAMIIGMLAASEASAKRINEVMSNKPDIQDRPEAISIEETNGRLVFEDVCFSYNGKDCAKPVLNHINLVAEPGQTVAILGSTGSGKTSLVNLIPRFYEVSSGRITLDGVDLRDMKRDSLLAQIGIALQETVLFSGSVRDNIRYGRMSANDEEVIVAAKASQAHEFIMSLPEGYDSRIEQRGANLSGGQKQRIAIARALLLKPRILILDDSTSAVDVDTEAQIQDALEKAMKDTTSIIIAQRISTVLTADKIIVLDNGRITAEGTHAELIKNSPIYQEIYESQLGNGLKKATEVTGN